jgi:hypothetical protein
MAMLKPHRVLPDKLTEKLDRFFGRRTQLSSKLRVGF